MMPSSNTAAISSEVAIGRRMKRLEKLIARRSAVQGKSWEGNYPEIIRDNVPMPRKRWRSDFGEDRGGTVTTIPVSAPRMRSVPTPAVPAMTSVLRRGVDLRARGRRRDLAGFQRRHLAAFLEAELARGDHEIAGLQARQDDHAAVAGLVALRHGLHRHVLDWSGLRGLAGAGTVAPEPAVAWLRFGLLFFIGTGGRLVGDKPDIVAVRAALHRCTRDHQRLVVDADLQPHVGVLARIELVVAIRELGAQLERSGAG